MSGVLQFHSWGFTLFVPPVPFSQPPAQPRFVMLDDLNHKFYDVNYGLADLENKTSWVDLHLYQINELALVFPPEQQTMLERVSCAIALIVSVQKREGDIIHARCLGSVMVRPLPPDRMNWSGLEAKKGPELASEMRSGLLRHVWSRSAQGAYGLATPAAVLNDMGTNFHRDGVALSFQLDDNFVGAKVVEAPSCWRIENIPQKQMVKSMTRAAAFIDY